MTKIDEWINTKRNDLVHSLGRFSGEYNLAEEMELVGGLDESYIKLRESLVAKRELGYSGVPTLRDQEIERLISDLDSFAAVREAQLTRAQLEELQQH